MTLANDLMGRVAVVTGAAGESGFRFPSCRRKPERMFISRTWTPLSSLETLLNCRPWYRHVCWTYHSLRRSRRLSTQSQEEPGGSTFLSTVDRQPLVCRWSARIGWFNGLLGLQGRGHQSYKGGSSGTRAPKDQGQRHRTGRRGDANVGPGKGGLWRHRGGGCPHGRAGATRCHATGTAVCSSRLCAGGIVPGE